MLTSSLENHLKKVLSKAILDDAEQKTWRRIK